MNYAIHVCILRVIGVVLVVADVELKWGISGVVESVGCYVYVYI